MHPSVIHYRPSAHQRGEDTRRRILQTAIDVFAALGYEGASTRVLAERAGVNLPAIQYYFGSKEGLYRAAIDDIIVQIEERMGPVAERVRAALARGGLSRGDLLDLLQEMLDAFVAQIVGGEQLESRRLLFARAEIERTEALDRLHDRANRQVGEPCMALVGRLIDRPDDDESTILKTVAILGQVAVFCNLGTRRVLHWSEFNEDRMRAVQAIVRQHTQAIFRAQA
jgi:TetR/AcrR family transcriptional regulator, regulator of cefoperazone and chloramphenicol sensitivity